LLVALRNSVRELVADEAAVAVAYSGGLDSSVVAALARDAADTRCYSAAVPGSHDAATVEEHAQKDGLRVEQVALGDAELVELVRAAARLVGRERVMAIAYTVPLLAVMDHADEKVILAGNGADELFGGYEKYLRATDPAELMREDLEKSLHEASMLGTKAKEQGKRMGFPFLSDEVRQLAQSMPLEAKIRPPERKVVLRDIARELHLDSHERPKKAAQYSSGVFGRMKKLAKSQRLALDEWVASMD
jgi:asparagine synthase (glutamine-hydrolysing)